MKENSIEEAIERLEKGMSDICFSVTYSKEEEEEDLKILLTDYKRVLKENERISSENGIGKRQYEELVDDYEKLNLENIELQKENEELKKDYYDVINKIENKIDRFDYEFKKAKRQNNKDKSDYYWDLIINFKKFLESEENK